MDVKGIDLIRPQEIQGFNRTTGSTSDFGKVLSESLSEVNRLQAQADQAVEALATGQGVSLHDTMIALERADLSFRLMMQVRNKIVEAYQQILSIQV